MRFNILFFLLTIPVIYSEYWNLKPLTQYSTVHTSSTLITPVNCHIYGMPEYSTVINYIEHMAMPFKRMVAQVNLVNKESGFVRVVSNHYFYKRFICKLIKIGIILNENRYEILNNFNHEIIHENRISWYKSDRNLTMNYTIRDNFIYDDICTKSTNICGYYKNEHRTYYPITAKVFPLRDDSHSRFHDNHLVIVKWLQKINVEEFEKNNIHVHKTNSTHIWLITSQY